MDNLIKDINCGKFTHHHDDCLAISDDHESSLMLSHIESATPYEDVLEETMCSFAVNEVRSKSTRKTYVDRVERIIAEQYHRDKQMTTASYLHSGLVCIYRKLPAYKLVWVYKITLIDS